MSVTFDCQRCEPPLVTSCLYCGADFILLGHAIVAVLAMGEPIGHIGSCCLAPDARERLAEESRKFEASHG